MELREFVRDALVQLVTGIRDAQAATVASGARIAPPTIALVKQLTSEVVLEEATRRPLHLVEFDIAITATHESGKAGKIGVLAATLGISAEGHAGQQSERVSRVRFSVPIAFPAVAAVATARPDDS